MNYSLTSDSTPSAGWFETPPQPAAPCKHERSVEGLRGWLSRQPLDGHVVVGDVLLRLGRAPRNGA